MTSLPPPSSVVLNTAPAIFGVDSLASSSCCFARLIFFSVFFHAFIFSSLVRPCIIFLWAPLSSGLPSSAAWHDGADPFELDSFSSLQLPMLSLLSHICIFCFFVGSCTEIPPLPTRGS